MARPRKIRVAKRPGRLVFGGAARAGARNPKQVMAALGRSRVRSRKRGRRTR